MYPSAREVEEVVLSTLRRGDWRRAVKLLAGAVTLPCVPTTRTYAEVVAAVAKHGTWEETVRVCDRLHNSPLSARALYRTAADALLTDYSGNNNSNKAEFLLAIVLAARRRRVPLATYHLHHCSRMLQDAGNWRGALLAGSQERLVQQAPALAHPMMLAAASGRHWESGSKIMSSLLASCTAPSGTITENFIRCFTPAAPWWRALAVASVLSCSNEPGVLQVACELRNEVNRGGGQSSVNAEEKKQQILLRLVEGHLQPCDLTVEEATDVFALMGEQHWVKALDLLRQYPVLLTHTPHLRVLLPPLTLHHNNMQRQQYNWEAVWHAITHTLANAPMDEVLTTARFFFIYLHGVKEEEMKRAGRTVSMFINARRKENAESLDPTLLQEFLSEACACGCWEAALLVSKRPTAVFSELAESDRWEAALTVHAAMQPNARERVAPQLEHLFIARGLWEPALLYAQLRLPADTLTMRSLAVPLCAALGQWYRVLQMLQLCAPNPTKAEKLLKHYCILEHGENLIRIASKRNDWVGVLQAWKKVQRVSDNLKTVSTKENEKEPPQLRMSPHAVMRTAKLLLDHQRYDDCCIVVSTFTPNVSEPILLRCLRLFHYIRLSPLSYGRVLQEFREFNTPYRVVLDCYAVLALTVSKNYTGAFSILLQLVSCQNEGTRDTVVKALGEVPHIKKMLPSILCEIAKPSQASDLENVMLFLIPCVGSLEDVDLFNKPLKTFWMNENDILRNLSLRVSVELLRHMVSRDLPVPFELMQIIAAGLEHPDALPTALILYESLLRCSTVTTQESDNKTKSGTLLASEDDIEAIFKRCIQVFICKGQWSHALAAMQHCKTTDSETLFRTTVLLKEERERRERLAYRVILEATKESEERWCKIPPGQQMEDTILTLTQLHAWKNALTLFNERVEHHHSSGETRGSWGMVVGALLSCVATCGPWETALHLVKTVRQDIQLGSASIEKGLTDVLRSVKRHSGAIMCSRVLLYMVEEMGVIPTPSQYEVLLRSFLWSKLTAVERDVCGMNLRRLSHSLNEKEIVDLVAAITTSGASWKNEGDISSLGRWMSNSHHSGSSTPWMPLERPLLSDEELDQLCHLAPLIVLATSRMLESLSRQSFSGRFRPFELKLLLQHYRTEVLLWVDKIDSTELGVDTQLVKHCMENHLLHVLLVPYEREWRRLVSSKGNDTIATSSAAVESFMKKLRWEVFHGFVSHQTVSGVWDACHSSVEKLTKQRWPWLCEHELLREVQRRGGKPPLSLHTRPNASRSEIESYWATYGRLLWPGLFLSGPELCQLAVYVPLVEPLLRGAQMEEKLMELLADIHVTHFSSEAIPREEELLRQPRSLDVILIVFKLAFKTLKRLHTQLDMDARGGRHYYYFHPDTALWQRHEQKSDNMHTIKRLSRWSLALRILHHYRRSTTNALQPRTLAALVTACAADFNDDMYEFKKQQAQKKLSWWELAIRCAHSVEPTLNHSLWCHVMQLASLPQQKKDDISMIKGDYRVENIHDTSLQATMRVMLDHINRSEGNIPFDMSLLLLDQMKELLCESLSSVDKPQRDADGDDALAVWVMLQTHHCLEKMEPLHAMLLKRIVLERDSGRDII
ncbi:putative NADH-dependent fumarate reductase [Trypanosoma theileri]|uniref:Putative NADH-dependent fumarate reductase n=1 Tax=Trypanosoma theileri TaxID=67003 RepID=A0A1X0NLR6_9TRYP|nr:putative NADH-dependent fumarate reductase [Trypanosoma theileri]ORC85468.1 putative NADH-dependent fumarate reductase [Trypanosoma theileri]